MKPNVKYIVTKGSDDETFEVGDHIILLDDGSIICKEAQGWIDAADAEEAVKGMEYKLDEVYYKHKQDTLLREFEEITHILVNNS